MPKHHHSHALKKAIIAHWQKFKFYADNWQDIQKHFLIKMFFCQMTHNLVAAS